MNPIPEKLNDFAVYLEGETSQLGLATVDLPDMQALTEETAGAGIAGKVENPVVGHYDSMTMKLNWRMMTSNVSILSAPKVHALDLRGALQKYNAAEGTVGFTALKIVARGMPKNTGLGKFVSGKMMDNASEFELSYLKISIDDEPVVEIDKYNHVCTVHGVDYLARVREILGIGQ